MCIIYYKFEERSNNSMRVNLYNDNNKTDIAEEKQKTLKEIQK